MPTDAGSRPEHAHLSNSKSYAEAIRATVGRHSTYSRAGQSAPPVLSIMRLTLASAGCAADDTVPDATAAIGYNIVRRATGIAYGSVEELIQGLDEEIIKPALARFDELVLKKAEELRVRRIGT